MKSENLLLTVAIIAVAVSFAGAFFTFGAIRDYRDTWFTGFATAGDINLTVTEAAFLNFTVDSIDWGEGVVDEGSAGATLNTCCGGSVTNGNWSTVSQGFEVKNIGNVNLTLNLKTGEDAASFLGGANPEYKYNVTNIESNSCADTGGFSFNTFHDVNTTGDGTRVCDIFQFLDDRDELRIDIHLYVPSDSLTGALSDTMTAAFAKVIT